MSSSAVLVLLVPKKGWDFEDACWLYNIMVKYRHSISSLDNILNGFHRSYMFSKIDFKWINEPYFV
jgi:hypothetical protein